MKAVSIITGGGRGLGRVIAERLAADTVVIVVGRTEADLVVTCQSIEANGGEAIWLAGDVSDPATAKRAVQLAHEQGWTVRNLVCNAGIGKSGPTHEITPTAWRTTLATNVDGSFWFMQACLPEMMKQHGGTISVISSVAGVKGYAYEAAYTASKHALVGLAKTVALEYDKLGIICVPVCPNFIEGEMTNRTIQGVAKRRGISVAQARAIVAESTPQRRIIPVQEVAETIAQLCSGQLAVANGEPLILNG